MIIFQHPGMEAIQLIMRNVGNLLSRRIPVHLDSTRFSSCALEIGPYDVLDSYNNLVLNITVIYGTLTMWDYHCACASTTYMDTPLILN